MLGAATLGRAIAPGSAAATGQRGSHLAMTRAIAIRALMKLSGKWRSGRERLRLGLRRPSGRGGETPHAFRNDERVAAQSDRDMVMPTAELSSFEVVEPELV